MHALNPPPNFATVSPGVYRCGFFQTDSYPFISRLRVKTVLLLTPIPPAAYRFLTDQRIRVQSLGMDVALRREDITSEVIKEALEIVLDSKKYPLLIMCKTGAKQTGAVVGCLRRVQGWSFTSTVDEFRRFASGAQPSIEHLIEMLDVDLIRLPKEDVLPVWYSACVEAREPPPPPSGGGSNSLRSSFESSFSAYHGEPQPAQGLVGNPHAAVTFLDPSEVSDFFRDT